jgi:hypothetical protein
MTEAQERKNVEDLLERAVILQEQIEENLAYGVLKQSSPFRHSVEGAKAVAEKLVYVLRQALKNV